MGGTLKVRWHTRGKEENSVAQGENEPLKLRLQDALTEGHIVFVPRRSCLDHQVAISDGDGSELASPEADLKTWPNARRWTRLDGEGTEEILNDELREALKTSHLLTAEQVFELGLTGLPPGCFVRVGSDLLGPASLSQADAPWHISFVPETLGFIGASASSLLRSLGISRIRGEVKSIVISDDWIAYVANAIVKTLGEEMIISIVRSIGVGNDVGDGIKEGMQNSLGDLLAATAARLGFWVDLSPEPTASRTHSTVILHPLIQDRQALELALAIQESKGSIQVFRVGDQRLILPSSLLTPSAGALAGIEVGKEIGMGKIFPDRPLPDGATLGRMLDTLVSRAEHGSGYILLPHRDLNSRTFTFARHVDEGVKMLSNRELDQLGNFCTITKLGAEYHLPFFCTGSEWFATALKEMVRRRNPEVLGLALNVLGWGGGAIILTSKPDASGVLVHPVEWYGRTNSAFLKVTTLGEIPAILEGLTNSRLTEVMEDYMGANGVAYLRGITLVEDKESEIMGAKRPGLLPGQRNLEGYIFPFEHPGAMTHKQISTRATIPFPSTALWKILEEKRDLHQLRMFSGPEGVLVVAEESRVHEVCREGLEHLLQGLPGGWYTVGLSLEDSLIEFLQGIAQEADRRQYEQQQRQQAAEAEEISEQQRQQQLRQQQQQQQQAQLEQQQLKQQQQQLQQPLPPQQLQQQQQHSQQQQLQPAFALVGVAGTSGTGAGLGYEQQQLTGAQVSGTGGGDDQMGEGEDATHGQSRPRISTGSRRQSEGAAASHKGRGGIRSERPARERDISKGSTGEAKGSGSSRSRSPGRETKDHQPRSR
jgi:flagellar biosynthesis GTPase FlhF